MAIIASALAAIKSDPLACLGGAERVNACFAQAGHVWRDRLLDPAHTLALFLLQVLHGNTAIAHLRHLCPAGVCPSSYCEARARLPVSVVSGIVGTLCGECSRCIDSAAWLGRRVLVADGTGTLTPDARALREAWPQSSGQRPGCGFPAVKLLGLMDLATGMIAHLTVMRLHVQEFSQLAGMHTAVRAGDVLLADRGFCSFWHLAMLAALSADAVFRMHQKVIVDFTPGRACRGKSHTKRRAGMPGSKFVRRLGHEDQVVEWVRPRARPDWMSAGDFGSLPQRMEVRELRYRIVVRGRRTRVVTIVTTLLNAMRYPKREVARLYGLRWEMETNLRHLKTTLRMEHLKCKTVDGVLKELVIYVLVYNLVRAAMSLAAQRQGVADANRVSFIDAARWLSAMLARRPETDPPLIVNPTRPGRWCPRVKKKRMKEYDLMIKPRAEYTEPADATELVY